MEYWERQRALSSPTVDNFEQHWAKIVDSLVDDDPDNDTASATESNVSSPGPSIVPDSSHRWITSPDGPDPLQTPTNPRHGRLSDTHSQPIDGSVEFSQNNAITESNNSPCLPWEQVAAMHTYLFRIQLLTAFLGYEAGGCDAFHIDQPIGLEKNSIRAAADDDRGEPIVSDQRSHPSAYHVRIRLDRAEATRRARHREERLEP